MSGEGFDLSVVSRETLETLRKFSETVSHWTKSINLIAESTVDEIWARHILDAAQILHYTPTNPQIWCDLGSGAGFPGIVAAIINREIAPDCSHVLIESDRRKGAFLTLQAKALGLRCKVVVDRIEMAAPVGADIVTSRALAPLPKLLAYAGRHGNHSATYIFPKGQGASTEVETARLEHDFDLVTHPSKTDPHGSILFITNLTPRRVQA